MKAARMVVGVLGLLPLGCGGSTAATTRDGGADATECSPSPGTYTEHFEAESGGTGCPSAPSDQTLTIDESGMIPGRDAAPDYADGIAGCSTREDTATCTFTTDCGGAGVVSTTITFRGNSATGTQTYPSGCAFAVTVTKN